MQRLLTALLTPLLVILGGCSTMLKVTYQSDPPGAAVYQGSELYGYTPLTLEYEVTEEDKRQGAKLLQGTSVKWASGAAANVPTLTADIRQFGLTQQFTFQRPDSFPGRDIDVRVFLEMQKIQIMKQQAKAERDKAFWEALRAAQPATQPVQRMTNCTSTVVGNTVQTNCY